MSVVENAWPSIPPPPVIGKAVEVGIAGIAIAVPVAKLATSDIARAGVCPLATVEKRAVESIGVKVVAGACE